MKKLHLLSALMCSVALAAPAIAQDTPDSVVTGSAQFAKSVLISGLENPWELEWGPDDFLWVTERSGKRVTRVNPADGSTQVAITIDEVAVPGGQDGLQGMALHPELLQGTGNDYVYVAYTYQEGGSEGATPYENLRSKLVRLTYDAETQTLGEPMDIVTGLPASNDHNSARLKFGPDNRLYYTIGDQGNNQGGNWCRAIESQRLPTADEISAEDYVAYVGKSLRIELDGSIPEDNPELDGVVSHVFTYGHRNTQGLDFGPDGTLYSSDHGPKTDDEINLLESGGNYGWPNVAGFQDDMAYVYANWSASTTPCEDLAFSEYEIPDSVPVETESEFMADDYVPPLATMFTVPDDWMFIDPACGGIDFICWPTVGATSIEVYAPEDEAIPGWGDSLLVSTLKRGSIYRIALSEDGRTVEGPFERYFQSEDRFRDTALSPDNRTIYIATDSGGLAGSLDGGVVREVENPGAILVFTYEGEGEAAPASEAEATPAEAEAMPADAADATSTDAAAAAGVAAMFTAAQAEEGKVAYDANCAVCHGSTLTNATYGTPLAGQFFVDSWNGRPVAELYEYAHGNMPPSAPGSLPEQTYADIVAYILQTNGMMAGDSELVADAPEMAEQTIQVAQ